MSSAARVRTPVSRERTLSRPTSSLGPAGGTTTADSGRGTPEARTSSAAPSSSSTSSREQRLAEDLALLFTVQRERCFSRASRDTAPLSSTPTPTPTPSLVPSEADFIYQRVDLKALSRCLPPFVRAHLHRNGRYLPETFILRVNFWRRRRALGVDDLAAKRAAKDKSAAKESAAAAKEATAAKDSAAKSAGDRGGSPSRAASRGSSQQRSLSAKSSPLSASRATLISA